LKTESESRRKREIERKWRKNRKEGRMGGVERDFP
jgi:hypothetical protein